MWDGLQILKEIIDAGAAIRVLHRSYIDLTSPIGRGFTAFISAMAEDERLRIIKRTHEGLGGAVGPTIRPVAHLPPTKHLRAPDRYSRSTRPLGTRN